MNVDENVQIVPINKFYRCNPGFTKYFVIIPVTLYSCVFIKKIKRNKNMSLQRNKYIRGSLKVASVTERMLLHCS